MKTPLPLKMGDLVHPLAESNFVSGFTWNVNPCWPGETAPLMDAATLPPEKGRVCCIYAESSVMVYDLAWGEHGDPGSVRATFRHPLNPA